MEVTCRDRQTGRECSLTISPSDTVVTLRTKALESLWGVPGPLEVSGTRFVGLPIDEMDLSESNVAGGDVLEIEMVVPDIAEMTYVVDRCSSFCLSHGDTLCATVSASGVVAVWGTETGQIERIVAEGLRGVNTMVFSPCNKLLAVAGDSKKVTIFTTNETTPCSVLCGHTSAVEQIVWSGHGAILASCSWDQTTRIWDAKTGSCLHTIIHESSVHCLDLFGEHIITGGTQLLAWTSSGVRIQEFVGHNELIFDVTSDVTAEQIISCGSDKTIRIWDTKTGGCARVLSGHAHEIYRMGVSRSAIFSVDSCGTACLWSRKDVARTSPLLRLNCTTSAVAISRCGKWLFTVTEEGIHATSSGVGDSAEDAVQNVPRKSIV